jgi:aspartyl-tRNA(Asn)/glutamyl-tRNA(Gln) amidotransferase subunit B
LESGRAVTQQTRGFDVASDRTYPLRTKEDEVDYRYMPDPDLPPLRIDEARIERVRAAMPESLDALHEQLLDMHELTLYDAQVLVGAPAALMFFERTLAECAATNADSAAVSPQLVARWVTGELVGQMARRDLSFGDEHRAPPIEPSQLASLLVALVGRKLTPPIAKRVLSVMLDGSSSSSPAPSMALDIAHRRQWLPLLDAEGSDADAKLREMCARIVDAHPDSANEYRAGRHRNMKFFVGQVMKETRGRADPHRTHALFEQLLKE